MKINKKYIPYVVLLAALIVFLIILNGLNKDNISLVRKQIKVEQENKEFERKLTLYEKRDAVRQKEKVRDNKRIAKLESELKNPPIIKVVYKDRVVEVVTEKDCSDEIAKRDVVIREHKRKNLDLEWDLYDCRRILKECENTRKVTFDQTKVLSKKRPNVIVWLAVGIVIGGASALILGGK